MSASIFLQQTERIGGPFWSIVVPGVILLLALWVTWALYRHFSD